MRPLLPAALLALVALAGCERKAAAPPAAAPSPAPAAAGGPAPATGALVLGHVGSLTGSEASFGTSTQKGVLLAVEEANAAGGVKGRKVELRSYDSRGRPEEAASAVTRLVSQDRALAIIGENASTNSIAMAEVAQRAGVPMVSPTSTAEAVTERGDFIFRVCFIDAFQGQVMAKFAREHLKLDRVAVLEDAKSAYSLGLARVFREHFERLGGAVTTSQTYALGDTDFRGQLTAIKRSKPQAVWVPGYYTDVGLIARQAKELGLAVPLLGADGWDSAKLYELSGGALEGAYWSNHYSPDDPSERIQGFIRKFQQRFGHLPESTAVLGYDAAGLVFAAAARAPDLSGAALRTAIAETRDYPGVSGSLRLDAKRNAVKPAVVLRVEGDTSKFVSTVQP